MSVEIRNGVAIHLEQLGEAGPPVVMLHGLFVGSMASWYFTAAPALAKTHRVLLYDLRGHGQSERPATGYDVATMAKDLEAIADAFSDRPIMLVGHSYGAVVALSYALTHPSRVSTLVMVEAPLPPSRLEELEAFARKSSSEMLAALPSALTDSFARGGRRSQRLAASLDQLATQTSLLADLRSAHDIPDEALASLRCKTLCIYGKTSSCLSVGERLARTIPHARLVTLEGGHFLPLEAPGDLTREIVEVANA